MTSFEEEKAARDREAERWKVLVRQRLAQLIKASGMPQAEVARRLGEERTWINNRIKGVSDIKADELPRIAAVLNVPITAFFEEAQLVPQTSSQSQNPPIASTTSQGVALGLPYDPTTREARAAIEVMREMRRLLDSLEASLRPPEPPDAEERAG